MVELLAKDISASTLFNTFYYPLVVLIYHFNKKSPDNHYINPSLLEE
mgnify:CR=1 FL=1